jgi:serpin B
MAYAGARERTATQMAKALHLSAESGSIPAGFPALLKELNDTNASASQLVLANAIWTQQGYPLLKPYQAIVRDQFGASLNQVDFKSAASAACQQINSWVAGQTHDRIQELIAPGLPDEDTRMVLASAAYFKSLWRMPFKRSLTKNAPFHLYSEESVSVPIMQKKVGSGYVEMEDLQVLELPYLSHRLSMVIFLPRKTGGLSLTASQLDWLLEQCCGGEGHEVAVSLPRFKFASKFSLASAKIRPAHGHCQPNPICYTIRI